MIEHITNNLATLIQRVIKMASANKNLCRHTLVQHLRSNANLQIFDVKTIDFPRHITMKRILTTNFTMM